MRKPVLAVLLSLAVLSGSKLSDPGVLLASSAGEIPAAPNIVDAADDANHHSWITGSDLGLSVAGADVLAGWFTHDAQSLYLHVQTASGLRAESFTFDTYTDPGDGSDCMTLSVTTKGVHNESFSSLTLRGDCGESTVAFGPVLEEEGPDGTSILIGTFPRADVALFADGNVIAGPDILSGYNTQDIGTRNGIIDSTDVGSDYELTPPVKLDPQKKKRKKNRRASFDSSSRRGSGPRATHRQSG